MLPATKVNCFIFACSHPSSVKKLDEKNRNTFTYIGWHRFESSRKQIHGKKSGIYQNYFFCLLSRHQTESKRTEST